MRHVVGVSLWVLASLVAIAEAEERWTSKILPISLDVPVGWANTSSNPDAARETFGRDSGLAGRDDVDTCTITYLRGTRGESGASPVTQESLNKGTEPLSIGFWIEAMPRFGLEKVTWIESRHAMIVDGKILIHARGTAGDASNSLLFHVGLLMTPDYSYRIRCLFLTDPRAYPARADLRASPLEEFERIFRSLRVAVQ